MVASDFLLRHLEASVVPEEQGQGTQALRYEHVKEVDKSQKRVEAE